MPVEVRGFKEAKKAFKAFQPDLAGNLNKEVRSFAQPVVRQAQGFVESEAGGLKNWVVGGSAKSFAASKPKERKGFPKFNASTVKRGIRFSTAPTRKNPNGFISIYRIINSNPAGAIYEWAGRNPPSSKKSSRPNFARQLGSMAGTGQMRGRVIFKAWDEDKGKAQSRIISAVDKTLRSFQSTMKKSVVVKN